MKTVCAKCEYPDQCLEDNGCAETGSPLAASAGSAIYALLDFATHYAGDMCFNLKHVEWWPLVAQQTGAPRHGSNGEIREFAEAKLRDAGWEEDSRTLQWVLPQNQSGQERTASPDPQQFKP